MNDRVAAVDWWPQIVVAFEGEHTLECAVAADGDAPPDRLAALAGIEDPFIKVRVAHNPSTPADTLEALIESGLAGDVALNPAATPELLAAAWRWATAPEADIHDRIDVQHTLLEHPNTPLDLRLALCSMFSGPVTDRAVLASGCSVDVVAAIGAGNLDARQRRWWTGSAADVFDSELAASEDEVLAALYRPDVTAQMVERAFALHTTMRMSYVVAAHALTPPPLHAQLLARGCRPPLLLGAAALKNPSYPDARWSAPLEVLAHAGLGSGWLPDLDVDVAEVVVGIAPDWVGDMRSLLEAAAEVTAAA